MADLEATNHTSEQFERPPQRGRSWCARLHLVAALLLVLIAAEAPHLTTPNVAMQTQQQRVPVIGRREPDLPWQHWSRSRALVGWVSAARAAHRPKIVLSTLVSSPSPAAELVVSGLSNDGLPVVALTAYRHAADLADRASIHCGLSWTLLAAIGRVESDHGRFGGQGLLTSGLSTHRIIGIPLDGNGTALVLDTDHGRLDGDPIFDRAVGPMQFIPSTWVDYATDGNGDGIADPFNIFDAAAAAAKYLCGAGQDLRSRIGTVRAVLTYNHSDSYVATVLSLAATYAGTALTALKPSTPTVRSAPLPPANPSPPTALPPRHLLPVLPAPLGQPPSRPNPKPARPTYLPVTSASPTAQPCQSPPATTSPSPEAPSALPTIPSATLSPAVPVFPSLPTPAVVPSSPPTPMTLPTTTTPTPTPNGAPVLPSIEPAPVSSGCAS